MKILAVDDEAVARIATQAMVTALGHECLTAGSGEEAWTQMQTNTFDVIITDRVMPNLDGLQLCQRIRGTADESNYTYVVLATRLSNDEQARDGMTAGADDYLSKPVRLAQLEHTLIAAERVTALHRRLAEVNQLQADMITMLAHDARQPLTAVIGFCDGILEDWETIPDPTRQQIVAKVAAAARRLDQLIEDVLTMANLDSGTITCRAESIDITQALHAAASAAAGPALINVIVDPDTLTLVDPWHFRQIIMNLVGNALKYGTAPVAITVKSMGSNLTIEVSDGGEGVPTVFIPHLFERFTRAGTGVATQKQGTGFGLYIVQRLAEANNGHIAYEAAGNGGACFTLTLPRA